MAREGVAVDVGVNVDAVVPGYLSQGEGLVAAYNPGYAGIDAFAYPYLQVVSEGLFEGTAGNYGRPPQHNLCCQLGLQPSKLWLVLNKAYGCRQTLSLRFVPYHSRTISNDRAIYEFCQQAPPLLRYLGANGPLWKSRCGDVTDSAEFSRRTSPQPW